MHSGVSRAGTALNPQAPPDCDHSVQTLTLSSSISIPVSVSRNRLSNSTDESPSSNLSKRTCHQRNSTKSLFGPGVGSYVRAYVRTVCVLSSLSLSLSLSPSSLSLSRLSLSLLSLSAAVLRGATSTGMESTGSEGGRECFALCRQVKQRNVCWRRATPRRSNTKPLCAILPKPHVQLSRCSGQLMERNDIPCSLYPLLPPSPHHTTTLHPPQPPHIHALLVPTPPYDRAKKKIKKKNQCLTRNDCRKKKGVAINSTS